eukprot:40230-Eustigmatos_ZCMA.PRE.1
MSAADGEHVNMERYLLHHDAKVNHRGLHDQRTALHLACFRGDALRLPVATARRGCHDDRLLGITR